MKIIAFDIWADYGCFKIPYTVTSPLTFPVPTKTALYGIIGAFLGYDKRDYLKNFQDKSWKIGISLKNVINKIHVSQNLLNTKAVKMFARMEKGKSCRTQIQFEFLKNPKFRVYIVSDAKSELDKLERMLIAHKSTYTVSLGLSECLANFEFVGTYFENEISSEDEFVEINSILPLSRIRDNSKLDVFKPDRKYLKIHMPVEMKVDRELTEVGDFIVESMGKTIFAKPSKFVRIKQLSENIILF